MFSVLSIACGLLAKLFCVQNMSTVAIYSVNHRALEINLEENEEFFCVRNFKNAPSKCSKTSELKCIYRYADVVSNIRMVNRRDETKDKKEKVRILKVEDS